MIKNNNKGMTLVEIVIVLLIASIAMTITGGILVNSLGYFDTSTKNSLDKQTADGILDYINGEIRYASMVTVTDTPDDNSKIQEGWHCLYVAKHVNGEDETDNQNEDTLVLYKDGTEVFPVDYYSKRNLDIQIRGFMASERRLDMLVSLKDKQNKEVYKTTNTYELLNLNMKSDDSAMAAFWGSVATEYEALFYEKTDASESESTNNKVLWYIKDASFESKNNNSSGDNNDNGNTDSTGDGTVKDIIQNIDYTNYIGLYYPNIGYHYNSGDIVWYKGNYWQRIYDGRNDDSGPDKGELSWKCLSREFNKNSAYEKGDIIIYGKYYYQCNRTEQVYYSGQNPKTGTQWDIIGRTDDPEVIEIVKKNTYEKQPSSHGYATVLKNHLENTDALKSLQDPLKTGYDSFVVGKTYAKGSIVKMVNETTAADTDKYYDLWVAGKETSSAPGTPTSGWVKMDNIYDNKSSYTTGDIVYCKSVNDGYIRAKKDVFEAIVPQDDVYTNGQKYWEEYPKKNN